MEDLINSWKSNGEVFKKQLQLNIEQLNGNYPDHWYAFLSIVDYVGAKSILDVGCGCGALYQLCRNNLDKLTYHGIDYSVDAIRLARVHWKNNSAFSCKDFQDLTKSYISDYDLVHLGALLDVLPNGDEALDFILGLKPKNLVLGRIKTTENASYFKTYTAYGLIKTCEYYHNARNLQAKFDKAGYEVMNISDTILLRKQNA